MKPQRIQRKRAKGWRMPENTVYVGRPSKWGNPFKINTRAYVDIGGEMGISMNIVNLESSLEFYRIYIKRQIAKGELDISELKGKNLCCWCGLDSPCHADILLELANESEAKDE